ncbi:MAG: ABC transporter permease [Deltaproteobacteria bacterium]|nr:ABC transporter permease [Deltaproteobacteria bacterium]
MKKSKYSDSSGNARQEGISDVGKAEVQRNQGRYKPSQETIVLGTSALIAIILSITLEGFFSLGNFFALLRSISVLGVFGLGMAIVVIGKGIDLSIVAIGFATGALSVKMINADYSLVLTLCVCIAIACGLGIINGFLISIVEIPALFATLASSFLSLGIVRSTYVPNNVANLAQEHNELLRLGGNIAGHIPIPVIIFTLCALVVYLFLSRTVRGRFIYAHGDNADAARLTGIAVRPLTMVEYGLSAVIGYIGGMMMVISSGVLQYQVVEGTFIYDIILVVVLGGVSLVGGRGSVICVIAGSLLIGVMRNAMTIMNIDAQIQNIIMGGVLLMALVVDSYVHPRDDETAKQGD